MRRYTVREGEVFADIARHFDIGYTALVTANPGVDPWLPGVGREITIPALHIMPDAPQQHVVTELSQFPLSLFAPRGTQQHRHQSVPGTDTSTERTRILVYV